MARVYIYRGLPGAGKSFQIKKAFPNFEPYMRWGNDHSINFYPYLSTDLYWYTFDSRTYDFRPKEIGKAHSWNFRCYQSVLDLRQYETVIVDNTNISAWEISPYVLGATANGFEHEIVTVWVDPILCCKRNVHNVPDTVILSMYQKLITETLPTFWNHKIVYPDN
jgi:predicted kinase